MAQGIITSLRGNRTGGVTHGHIRPVTGAGVEVNGQDVFFNSAQVTGLGDVEPLRVGDVVSYTHTYARELHPGIRGQAFATAIERVARGPQDDEPAPVVGGSSTRATGEDDRAVVEQQMWANDIYRAI